MKREYKITCRAIGKELLTDYRTYRIAWDCNKIALLSNGWEGDDRAHYRVNFTPEGLYDGGGYLYKRTIPFEKSGEKERRPNSDVMTVIQRRTVLPGFDSHVPPPTATKLDVNEMVFRSVEALYKHRRRVHPKAACFEICFYSKGRCFLEISSKP